MDEVKRKDLNLTRFAEKPNVGTAANALTMILTRYYEGAIDALDAMNAVAEVRDGLVNLDQAGASALAKLLPDTVDTKTS